MHDERSTLLVCYMEWEPFSVFLVQHFLPQILNYWCQVLIQFRVDTCGYQVCPDSMKYMLIMGYFNQSTSFSEQFGSSSNTSNIYSEGAGLESQLQHQLSLSSLYISSVSPSTYQISILY